VRVHVCQVIGSSFPVIAIVPRRREVAIGEDFVDLLVLPPD